jgi:hypothetical protein
VASYNLVRPFHTMVNQTGKSLILIVSVSFLITALVLFLPTVSRQSSAFSGSTGCNTQGSTGPWKVICGSYDAYQLEPYLTSTTPSGLTLNVGWCQYSGGTCVAHTTAITAGHYGTEFDASKDTLVYSYYMYSGTQVSGFQGTDYWWFN